MSHKLHLIITGSPGIGKTTLITKIINVLKTDPDHVSKSELHGFYATEVRNSSGRIGFQVIAIDDEGSSGTLSSINSKSKCRVGKYGVEVEEFEKIALPQLQNLNDDTNKKKILIIDEIGKMELFSTKFIEAVNSAFQHPNLVIVATIPIPNKKQPIAFVEKIRTDVDSLVYSVNAGNRNGLVTEIVNKINNFQ